jgi:hypothetical protein
MSTSPLFAGERLIQYASENLVTEVLIHPQTNTFIQCMRNLLSSFTRHRHIIHAGYTFTGNGSWILQVMTMNYCVFAKFALKSSPSFHIRMEHSLFSTFATSSCKMRFSVSYAPIRIPFQLTFTALNLDIGHHCPKRISLNFVKFALIPSTFSTVEMKS